MSQCRHPALFVRAIIHESLVDVDGRCRVVVLVTLIGLWGKYRRHDSTTNSNWPADLRKPSALWFQSFVNSREAPRTSNCPRASSDILLQTVQRATSSCKPSKSIIWHLYCFRNLVLQHNPEVLSKYCSADCSPSSFKSRNPNKSVRLYDALHWRNPRACGLLFRNNRVEDVLYSKIFCSWNASRQKNCRYYDTVYCVASKKFCSCDAVYFVPASRRKNFACSLLHRENFLRLQTDNCIQMKSVPTLYSKI